jgi:hypothetical protein
VGSDFCVFQTFTPDSTFWFTVRGMSRAFLLLALFVSFDAAADTFRCGTRLVVEGDTLAQVRSKCGEPQDIQTSTMLRRPIVWIHGRPVFVGEGLVEVPVESWIYNLGPNKFMRRVRFVDGQVTEIETLGYGYS